MYCFWDVKFIIYLASYTCVCVQQCGQMARLLDYHDSLCSITVASSAYRGYRGDAVEPIKCTTNSGGGYPGLKAGVFQGSKPKTLLTFEAWFNGLKHTLTPECPLEVGVLHRTFPMKEGGGWVQGGSLGKLYLGG